MSRRLAAMAVLSGLMLTGLVGFSWKHLTGVRHALVDGISIRGDAAFLERTQAALQLLKERHRDGYVAITRHVLRIEQADRSGADVWNRRIQVADRTSTYSTTWYASSLIHDCRHVSLYNDYLAAYPNQSVPADIYSGQDAELACMRLQIEALIHLQAPQHEIDWAKQQDGSFPDVDKDGKYDAKDYKKRNW